MIWNRIDDSLPEEKMEVLLHWSVPDMAPIYRLGSLFFKPYAGDAPIWKFELDCGDASGTIFSNRSDEQPTHWASLKPAPAAASQVSPPDASSPASAVEADAGNRERGR